MSVGFVCLKKTSHSSNAHRILALLPILFGIQQALEGMLWLSLDGGDLAHAQLSGLGYSFFSHFFWLVWIPLSGYYAESKKGRRQVLLLITGVGIIFGLTLYIPFLFYPDWLLVSILHHSILYETTLIYDDYLSREYVTALYLLIVVLPLMISTDHYYKILAVLIIFSMAVAIVFFSFAFISVWCFFAAAISLYVYFIADTKGSPER